jgi:uncharacterized protein YwgA
MRKERLASFVKALDDYGVITFDKNRFNHRLKMQKYVYIARCFGIRMPYNYSLYIHGPYSPSLADDYYAVGNYQNNVPLDINEKFVKLVKGKSEEWLELAATTIMVRKRYSEMNHNTLIDLVKTAKPWTDSSALRSIVATLERFDCLG